MYVERVANRSSPPAILLRESYRENGKVKKRTLANISDWPADRIEALKQALAGGRGPSLPGRLQDAFKITRSRPHGHVAAVVGTLRRIGLHTVVAGRRSRERDLVEALICSRVLEPRAKLATARSLASESLTSSLGQVLGVEDASVDDLYGAMDWLLARQARIEQTLAHQHLQGGSLVLYDVTSTYFEGRCCSLAKLGHSRDERSHNPQIVIGLLCDSRGCPVSVEVFPGNTADPTTLSAQVVKLRKRLKFDHVVLVGDRGMLTSARIREDLAPNKLDWISCLRAPHIRGLVESGALQLSLFDQRDLGEITSEEFSGERLVACKNPFLAEERARKREALLAATEARLAKVLEATRRKTRPLRGKDAIAVKVGKVINRAKVEKHFTVTISDDALTFERNPDSIKNEAALDGIYVVRTSVPNTRLSAEQVVSTYKSLSSVERAFRSTKSVDLHIRPVHHWLEDRVRAHVFICMLAYYVEWHMREELAPILFDDDDKAAARRARTSPVAPAKVSDSAQLKAANKRTPQDDPVHSFRTLLADLATVCRNTVQPSGEGMTAFEMTTVPTPAQARAFNLLHVTAYV